MRTFKYLSNILCRYASLSLSCISKEIDNMARSIVVNDCTHMSIERQLCHLCIPCQFYILSKSSLLPEYGYTSSKLCMTKKKLIIDYNDLFCLASICYVSFVIYTSCIIPCTSSQVHTSRNQSHQDWCISQSS